MEEWHYRDYRETLALQTLCLWDIVKVFAQNKKSRHAFCGWKWDVTQMVLQTNRPSGAGGCRCSSMFSFAPVCTSGPTVLERPLCATKGLFKPLQLFINRSGKGKNDVTSSVISVISLQTGACCEIRPANDTFSLSLFDSEWWWFAPLPFISNSVTIMPPHIGGREASIGGDRVKARGETSCDFCIPHACHSDLCNKRVWPTLAVFIKQRCGVDKVSVRRRWTSSCLNSLDVA